MREGPIHTGITNILSHLKTLHHHFELESYDEQELREIVHHVRKVHGEIHPTVMILLQIIIIESGANIGLDKQVEKTLQNLTQRLAASRKKLEKAISEAEAA